MTNHEEGISPEQSLNIELLEEALGQGLAARFVRTRIASRILESSPLLSQQLLSQLLITSSLPLSSYEIIPPSLRHIDDFAIGQPVIVDRNNEGRTWQKLHINKLWSEGQLDFIEVIGDESINKVRSIVKLQDIAVWPQQDFELLLGNHSYGRGHLSWARFLTKIELAHSNTTTDIAEMFIKYIFLHTSRN